MSRKRNKKKHFSAQPHQSQPAPQPGPTAPKPAPAPPPPAVPAPTNLTFESMEDKIRGEEILFQEENKKEREARDIKKKLEDSEVDRRLEQLRKQLGLK